MPAPFPPGDIHSLMSSRWNEFIEVRDSVLAVLSAPLSVSRLGSIGTAIGGGFRRRPRKRKVALMKIVKLLS